MPDPTVFIVAALVRRGDDAFERLRCVAWYDCVPLERYLRGDAPAGTA